jgi:hypothetical protein
MGRHAVGRWGGDIELAHVALGVLYEVGGLHNVLAYAAAEDVTLRTDRVETQSAVSSAPTNAEVRCSVETELVALDVLHRDARLVVVIGRE